MHKEAKETKEAILKIAREKYPELQDEDFGIKVGMASVTIKDKDGKEVFTPLNISIWYNYNMVDLKEEINSLGDEVNVDPHLEAISQTISAN